MCSTEIVFLDRLQSAPVPQQGQSSAMKTLVLSTDAPAVPIAVNESNFLRYTPGLKKDEL